MKKCPHCNHDLKNNDQQYSICVNESCSNHAENCKTIYVHYFNDFITYLQCASYYNIPLSIVTRMLERGRCLNDPIIYEVNSPKIHSVINDSVSSLIISFLIEYNLIREDEAELFFNLLVKNNLESQDLPFDYQPFKHTKIFIFRYNPIVTENHVFDKIICFKFIERYEKLCENNKQFNSSLVFNILLQLVDVLQSEIITQCTREDKKVPRYNTVTDIPLFNSISIE